MHFFSENSRVTFLRDDVRRDLEGSFFFASKTLTSLRIFCNAAEVFERFWDLSEELLVDHDVRVIRAKSHVKIPVSTSPEKKCVPNGRSLGATSP